MKGKGIACILADTVEMEKDVIQVGAVSICRAHTRFDSDFTYGGTEYQQVKQLKFACDLRDFVHGMPYLAYASAFHSSPPLLSKLYNMVT